MVKYISEVWDFPYMLTFVSLCCKEFIDYDSVRENILVIFVGGIPDVCLHVN